MRALRAEIMVVVEDAPGGGYVARGADAPISAEAGTIEELRAAIQDAVRAHFSEDTMPAAIRLCYICEELLPV